MPALLAPEVILPVYVVTPFVLMLLAIAIFPLTLPHWWEPNRNKLLISGLLGLPVLLLYLGRRPHALLETAEEYVSFILLLAGLYVISGGIRLHRGSRSHAAHQHGVSGPGRRPGLVPRHDRGLHALDPPAAADQPGADAGEPTVIFFIFLVSNIGGLLTPAGRSAALPGLPPGGPLHLDLPAVAAWLLAVAALLLIYFVWDSVLHPREPSRPSGEIGASSSRSGCGARSTVSGSLACVLGRGLPP